MSFILSKSISRIPLNYRSCVSTRSLSLNLINNQTRSFRSQSSKLAWSEAVKKAESLVNPSTKPIIDFKQLVQDDLSLLTQNIKEILSSGHPVLNTISQYYFNVGGKHIRPIIILLLSQAVSIAPKKLEDPILVDIDQPIDEKFNLNGSRWKDDYNAHGKPNSSQLPKNSEGCSILPSQRRLAELAEVIHTASLFHDDVIDNSDLRRNAPSVNAQFGNKMAILGGDFLLARASVSLARLRNVQVVEIMSTVIANLVEGELLQIKDALPTEHCDANGPSDQVFEYYLEKTYLKTASLIANSCRGAAVLSSSTDEISEISFEYGKNLGMAFQLIDDMLDFVVSADEFGKPVGADLELGLTTAPVLFAWQEFPELGPLIKRKFSESGDVQKVRDLVFQSQGLLRTKDLAIKYCNLAITAISQLPYSESREALIQLCEKVIERKR